MHSNFKTIKELLAAEKYKRKVVISGSFILHKRKRGVY